MGTRIQSIVDQAALLTVRQRVQLVEKLLNCLEPASSEDSDEAWREEIERRSKSAQEGSVRLLPWRRVKIAARRRARGRV